MCSWQGRPQDGTTLLFELYTAPVDVQGPGLPVVILAAAGNGDEDVLLQPGQIGDFLQAHQNRCFVVDDAGRTHWALVEHFRQDRDSRASDALWAMSRHCRLYDIGLLEQLVSLAADGFCQAWGDLSVVSQRRRGVEVEARNDFERRLLQESRCGQLSPGFRTAIGDRIRTIAQIYQTLSETANRLATSLPTPCEQDYGPLGVGLQVQGAIALHAAALAGSQVDADAAARAVEGLRNEQRRWSQQLLRDSDAKACFPPRDGQMQFDAGYPKVRRERLLAWLDGLAASLTGKHKLPLLHPRLEDQQQPSTVPEAWGRLRLLHRSLHAWSELLTVSQTLDRFVLNPSKSLTPQYTVLPRVESTAPRAGQLRLLMQGNLLRGVGQAGLVVGEFCDLELRSLAAICQRRCGHSALAQMFGEVDYAWQRVGPALLEIEWEDELRRVLRKPITCNQVVEAFLEAMSIRLGPEHGRQIARNLHGVDLSISAAKRVWEEILVLAPELREHLADQTMEALARALNADPDRCRRRLFRCIDPDQPSGWVLEGAVNEDPETVQDIHWALLGYQPNQERDHLRDDLAELNRNGELAPLFERRRGSRDLYEAIFSEARQSPSGRLRAAALFSEESAEHLDLADDAAKAGVFAIMAAGFRLCVYAGGTFAVEAPAGLSQDTPSQIGAVAAAAAGRVVGVPVRCCCRLGEGK